jgi:hypothetical protein
MPRGVRKGRYNAKILIFESDCLRDLRGVASFGLLPDFASAIRLCVPLLPMSHLSELGVL